MKSGLLLVFLALQASAQETFVLREPSPKIASPAITEASGLAVSPRSDDFLWIINDSGGTPEIHLCDSDGASRGSVSVGGVKNNDWEDLAAFVYKGESYLLIADTGDNSSRREEVRLLVVREPKLPKAGRNVAGEIPLAWSIGFTFEGGSRDCEAVAVDVRQEKIVLISKRTDPPAVYELPLRPIEKNPVAKLAGNTRTIAPNLSFLPYRNQPTGLDISADGKLAAIITYDGVFLFPKRDGQKWGEALSAQPTRIGGHKLPQAEAIAITGDGKEILCLSEGKNPAIALFARQE